MPRPSPFAFNLPPCHACSAIWVLISVHFFTSYPLCAMMFVHHPILPRPQTAAPISPQTFLVRLVPAYRRAFPTSKGRRRAKRAFQCPEPTGFFLDPKDCSGYFRCVHGSPHHHSCEGGLAWNHLAQICDWPHNVDCFLPDNLPGRVIIVDVSPTDKSPARTQSPKIIRHSSASADSSVREPIPVSGGRDRGGVSGRVEESSDPGKASWRRTKGGVPTTALVAMALVLILCYVVITAVVIHMRRRLKRSSAVARRNFDERGRVVRASSNSGLYTIETKDHVYQEVRERGAKGNSLESTYDANPRPSAVIEVNDNLLMCERRSDPMLGRHCEAELVPKPKKVNRDAYAKLKKNLKKKSDNDVVGRQKRKGKGSSTLSEVCNARSEEIYRVQAETSERGKEKGRKKEEREEREIEEEVRHLMEIIGGKLDREENLRRERECRQSPTPTRSRKSPEESSPERRIGDEDDDASPERRTPERRTPEGRTPGRRTPEGRTPSPSPRRKTPPTTTPPSSNSRRVPCDVHVAATPSPPRLPRKTRTESIRPPVTPIEARRTPVRTATMEAASTARRGVIGRRGDDDDDDDEDFSGTPSSVKTKVRLMETKTTITTKKTTTTTKKTTTTERFVPPLVVSAGRKKDDEASNSVRQNPTRRVKDMKALFETGRPKKSTRFAAKQKIYGGATLRPPAKTLASGIRDNPFFKSESAKSGSRWQTPKKK